MAYRLVIFDFDGTLADSAGWLRGVFNDVATHYGFHTVNEVELEQLRGLSTRDILSRLKVPLWKMPFIARHMRKRMGRDVSQISLFPGVEELLARLGEGGVTLAVVSSNSEENVKRILGPANASKIRHFSCGAGLFGKRSKFRKVMKQSGASEAETLAIGDEVRDLDAARGAGIAAGAVTWGYATAELLKDQGPSWVFNSLQEIEQAVLTSAAQRSRSSSS